MPEATHAGTREEESEMVEGPRGVIKADVFLAAPRRCVKWQKKKKDRKTVESR